MKKQLYSILEYRHSLLKSEIFHIGIVFYFSEPNSSLTFIHLNCDFLKNIYLDMDDSTLNRHLSYITQNIEKSEFQYANKFSIEEEFRRFLKKNILLEDSTVLQFSAAVVIINNENELSNEEIIDNYSKMLL